jgi:zinc-finger of transposase IS204/IS1001/IS1096/IS1165
MRFLAVAPNKCTCGGQRPEGARAYAHPGLKETRCCFCGRVHASWYDRKTRGVRDLSCGDSRLYLEFEVRRVHCGSCGKVKRERLDFLTDNPFYTKRVAYFVGRRCRQASIQDVAKELKLDCALDLVVGLELRPVLVLDELAKLRYSLVDLQFKSINEVTCPLDMVVRSQVLKFLTSHVHFEGTQIAST